MELIFCSLSSGSSGNCYYVGNGHHGILIDAGISASSIRRYMKIMNLPEQTLMGVLVSHNHTDHIRGLEVLSRRNSLPVFTTRNIWNSILPTGSRITSDCIRNIPLRQSFALAGFEIEAFPVSHDAPETIGFHIKAGERKLTVVTDLGHICETSARYIKAANILVIESNYDEPMLISGSYPWFLKKRILSDHGHLGNHQTSSFLAENINDGLRHICLAHLSRNNNTPEHALGTLHKTLSDRGVTLNGHTSITVLNRDVPSEMIRL
jgi:phosphoribosyl 1,2-cyclic phosphodiesterase